MVCKLLTENDLLVGDSVVFPGKAKGVRLGWGATRLYIHYRKTVGQNPTASVAIFSEWNERDSGISTVSGA
jgi:hypothetical protein